MHVLVLTIEWPYYVHGINKIITIIRIRVKFLFVINPSLSNCGSLSVCKKYFCLLQSVQTVFELDQNWTTLSIQALLTPSFARVRQRGSESDNWTLPRAEVGGEWVENWWSLTSTTHTWLQSPHRDYFTFPFFWNSVCCILRLCQ